jgi:hypothetical protein
MTYAQRRKLRKGADTHGVAEEGRDETGHCQQNLGLDITVSITIVK